MPHNLYLQLALPVPLRRVFDYLPPEALSNDPKLDDTLKPGIRIEVPFGNRTLTGILLNTTLAPSVDKARIKPAKNILDSTPIINQELLEFVLWAAHYYHCPIGESLQAALPTLLRQGLPATQIAGTQNTVWHLTAEGRGLPVNALKRASKQAAIVAILQSKGTITSVEIKPLNIARDALKRLENKKLITSTQEHLAHCNINLEKPLDLNREQQNALKAIDLKRFQASLLDGATGSGKTEIYLQAIAQVLERDTSKQALVLIPEIGLTPQTLARFVQRFGHCVVALHSGLNNRERLNAWVRANTGDAKVIIGTRSAIFTPFKNLGIIVVDEEHDPSFKQQDGFRYSARDLAAVRAKRLDIPLILGSATPSLESLHNTQEGRYQHLRIQKRAGNARPATIKIIDLNHTKLKNGFAPKSITAVAQHIEHGNQVLIFLNRRGFAPTLQCEDCGWVCECPHCDARLTLHHNPKHMHCHHCNYQCAIFRRCDACFSTRLYAQGHGTERSEQALQVHFPDTPVLRIDRDSTRGKNALPQMLKRIATGDPCILIGTQMLAKGHHFPNVTLVLILDADSGLFSADFRGPERMGQLLTQVSGRAGRAQKPGEVLLQSRYTQHPLLQALIHQGYHRFATLILKERSITQLPPFSYIALLRADALDPLHAKAFLQIARQQAEQLNAKAEIQILGPLPALMEKRGRRFRFQLQFKAASRNTLKHLINALIIVLDTQKHTRQLRWSVDIDPQDMS